MNRTNLTGTLIAALLASACATDTGTGALFGGGGGALIGGGIGALAGGKKGALIGAALGGVTGGVSGALIGRYMDKQKEALDRDLKAAHVERVGNRLVVKFESGILFDTDQTQLKPAAQKELADLARVLRDYPDTNLDITGFTDSTGSKEHNLKLSAERAQAVVDYLTSANVERRRLVSQGFGEDRPSATNATSDGREKNRRVEVNIEANEELKKADAENAQIKT